MLSINDAIRSRRSVRAFLPGPVPEQTLEAIFTLAQCAPSNCNRCIPYIYHPAGTMCVLNLPNELAPNQVRAAD